MTVYKASINGEEHEFAWSGWGWQILTPGDWIDITEDVISNTWVLVESVYSWDSWTAYSIKTSYYPPNSSTEDYTITLRQVL